MGDKEVVLISIPSSDEIKAQFDKQFGADNLFLVGLRCLVAREGGKTVAPEELVRKLEQHVESFCCFSGEEFLGAKSKLVPALITILVKEKDLSDEALSIFYQKRYSDGPFQREMP